MRTLLNLIWLLLVGIQLTIGYTIAGTITCAFAITIPFGVVAFRMTSYVAWPFGKAVIRCPSTGVGSGIVSLIWFAFCGWWLALGYAIAAIVQAVTIVGIASAIVSLKMIPVTCSPFGRQIMDRSSLAPWDHPLHSI